MSATPAAATANRQRLAYILAASHSGSTLLAMLLGSHSEICTVGELKATSLGDPARYRCSCGEPIRACGFWRAVAARMAQAGHVFDVTAAQTHIGAGASAYVQALLRPLHRVRLVEMVRDAALRVSPGWSNHLRAFHAVNRALIQALLDETGKRIVVDSSKVGIRLKYLLRSPGLDVKVVRLIRDGRAVALTYTDPAEYADAASPSHRGGGHGSSRDGERLSMQQAAREWRRSNEEADALVASLDPERCLTVTYEELCGATGEVLRRVFAFLGVDAEELPRNWRARTHHVVGNGMRFDTAAEVRLDDRWRTALPSQALAAFDVEAGALNRRLGYA